jgi:hypothetical protein
MTETRYGQSHGSVLEEWTPDPQVQKLEAEIKKLRTALRLIADEQIIQGMSPALFARRVLEN